MQVTVPFLGPDGPPASGQTVSDAQPDTAGAIRFVDALAHAAPLGQSTGTVLAAIDKNHWPDAVNTPMPASSAPMPASQRVIGFEMPVAETAIDVVFAPPSGSSEQTDLPDARLIDELGAEQAPTLAPANLPGVTEVTIDQKPVRGAETAGADLAPQDELTTRVSLALPGVDHAQPPSKEQSQPDLTKGQARVETLLSLAGGKELPVHQVAPEDARMGGEFRARSEASPIPVHNDPNTVNGRNEQPQLARLSPQHTAIPAAVQSGPAPGNSEAMPAEQDFIAPGADADAKRRIQLETRPQNAGKPEWVNPMKPAAETAVGHVAQTGKTQARATTQDRISAPDPEAKAAVPVREPQEAKSPPAIATMTAAFAGSAPKPDRATELSARMRKAEPEIQTPSVENPARTPDKTSQNRTQPADAATEMMSQPPIQTASVQAGIDAVEVSPFDDALQMGAGASPTAPQTSATAIATMMRMPELPVAIASQLAEAARAMTERPLELTLSPEELGKVRMTMNAQDGAMSVVLAIERPETLDLMRRNISALEAQFRDLGYRDVTFSFSHQGTGQGGSDQGAEEQGASSFATSNQSALENTDQEVTPLSLDLGASRGMDIRV